MKVRDVLKLLRKDGWYVLVTVGSLSAAEAPKQVRTSYRGWSSFDDIHPKTLKSILTQAGLKK